MAFIEVKDENGAFLLINIDDIVYVVKDNNLTRIAHKAHNAEVYWCKISTPFEEIREQILDDGQKHFYLAGKDKGVNEVVDLFRKKADCISREDLENYITKRLDGYLTKEEREEIERLAEFVAELPKFDILDIFTKK